VVRNLQTEWKEKGTRSHASREGRKDTKKIKKICAETGGHT